ncbi:hypothetical protein Syun_021809 [Stephania yunnanensis]|uniref:Uncharacterized protein n=1 Tax=Stephania yunnanensis TaxID=152371 RepID=A0AAP0NPG1_9MAGN
MAAVVLVSLPPPPVCHPAYFYMEYMDLLVENVPRLLMVRGYRRDVVNKIKNVIGECLKQQTQVVFVFHANSGPSDEGPFSIFKRYP